jgi:hypothetical protein
MSDLKWFKSVFLKHLKRGKFSTTSFVSFFTTMFRLDKRTIETRVCMEDVELRGAPWIDSKPVEGLINRRVLKMRKGQPIWLRIDTDEPFVTVENSRGCVNIAKGDWYAKYSSKFDQPGH